MMFDKVFGADLRQTRTHKITKTHIFKMKTIIKEIWQQRIQE